MAHGVYRLRGAGMLAVRDFFLALALFWGVALVAAHGPAHAVNLPGASAVQTSHRVASDDYHVEKTGQYASAAQGSLAALTAAQTSARPTVLMLSFVFAVLTVLNLAFLRHLRRVYAKPKLVRARFNGRS